MYQDSKRTCTAIVLLIKSFVWCRSRLRLRRGLLKLKRVTAFQNVSNRHPFFNLLKLK